jgi:NADPH:quinone reductase-like Zn-dependent oxidoreductase
MPPNTAAWLPAHGKPLEVKAAPYTSPQSNEIVIKVGAVAVNPVDWAIQDLGPNLFPWIKYPIIVGSDVAGEVAEVGPGVSRFKVGDRVVGHGLGVRNNPPEAGFQLYTVLKVQMVSPIPSSLSYESASVLPLGLSTAACGLFMKDYLALEYPSVPPKPTGKSLLVWGGATSVGSNAIQLAGK